jgi:predicted TIM-barrel enzyme
MKADLVLERLTAAIHRGEPIIVAGVGSGLTAKGAVAGGADALAIYNTAVYRIMGLPTALAFLPYDNANALTLRVAPEIMAVAGDVPVLVGLGAHDARRSLEALLDEVTALGAAGVTNEPFIGIYGDDLRSQLDAAGLGFEREVMLIGRAVERGMLALGWAFSPEEAGIMAKVGAQMVGAMVGVTGGGPAGGAALTSFDDAVNRIDAVYRAALDVREDVIVLGHGGPLNDPASVGELLQHTGAHGYVTGSTGERMPAEQGVAEAIRRFKSLKC